MSELLSRLCCGLQPYVAGEQPQDKNYIKLNTNENPYPPSDEVREILLEFHYERLKKYSDPNNVALRRAIANNYSVALENVFVGNGSDEVLAFCYPAFANEVVAFADVTYSFYPVYCDLFGKKAMIIPLNDDFSYNIERYMCLKCDMLIITNPNAPTSLAMSKESLESILLSNRNKVVVVDEAYSAYMGWSAVGLTAMYDNLLIVKTFSKAYSLAGARCGYAIGDSRLIEGLMAVKNSLNSYTVNSITEAVAIAAITDRQYFDTNVAKVTETRQWTFKRLRELGFYMPDSSANFLFARHATIPAVELYQKLKEMGILVRHFNKDKISNYIRITIGSDAEMSILVDKLKEIIDG